MLKLMFDPRGTMTTREYWKACAGIFALSITIATVGLFVIFQFETRSTMIATMMLASTCCLIAPYGKRLATLELSRWWIIGAVVAIAAIFVALSPVMAIVNGSIMDTVFASVGADAFLARTVGDNLAFALTILPAILFSLVPIAIVTVFLGVFIKPGASQALSPT